MKIKYFLFLGAFFFAPVKLFSPTPGEFTEPEPSTIPVYFPPRPNSIPREEWDPKWPELKVQYEKSIGTKFPVIINGKKYIRRAKAISYPMVERLTGKQLKYRGLVIHHAAIEIHPGETEVQAVRRMAYSQISSRGFSDVAYNEIVGHEGGVYEGRQDTCMGVHAGGTKECEEAVEAKASLWKYGPVPVDSAILDSLYIGYSEGMELDPDWLMLSLLLLGHLDKNYPTAVQMECAIQTIVEMVEYYEIPWENIYFHSEMPGYSRSQGLTPLYRKKTCPGKNFGTKEELYVAIEHFLEQRFLDEVMLRNVYY